MLIFSIKFSESGMTFKSWNSRSHLQPNNKTQTKKLRKHFSSLLIFLIFKDTFIHLYQRWSRSGFSRPNPTGKFQIPRRPAGQPVFDQPSRPIFLQKVFVYCSKHLTKSLQKGGMGKVFKFVTPDENLRKNTQKMLHFLQKILNFSNLL